MGGRVITAKEAVVKTAAVEVKTLTIKGKQVTLAVFRQLKEEHVLNQEHLTLEGVPWGIVNYFWGRCQEVPHLHVVWQREDELRRCCFFSGPERYKNVTWRALEERWELLTALVHFSVLGHDPSAEMRGDAYDRFWTVSEKWFFRERTPERVKKFLSANRDSGIVSVLYRQEEIRREYTRLLPLVGISLEEAEDFAVMRTEETRAKAASKQYERRWKQRYEELSQLDHLFIAV